MPGQNRSAKQAGSGQSQKSTSSTSRRIQLTAKTAPHSLGSLVHLKELDVRVQDEISSEDLEWLLEFCDEGEIFEFKYSRRRAFGLSCVLTEDADHLAYIGISSFARCLVWALPPKRFYYPDSTTQSAKTLSSFLLEPKRLIVGLELAHSAILISRDLSVFSNSPATTFQMNIAGIDLNALYNDRTDLTAYEEIADVFDIHHSNLISLIRFWQDLSEEGAALRAWTSLACAMNASRRALVEATTRETNTSRIGPEQIGFFGRALYICDRLEALKPKMMRGQFVDAASKSDGTIVIVNEKFSSKVRKDVGQSVIVQPAEGPVILGRVVKVQGRKSTIQLAVKAKVEVTSIDVMGKASRTLADAHWQTYMRSALDGSVGVYGSKITTRILWFGTARQRNRARGGITSLSAESVSPAADRLNPSQKEAHDAIVGKYSDDSNVYLVCGPPGTGKTSVIAASVNTFLRNQPTACIYCATASNVAAKNIAESLVKTGLIDFRLIVSQDFHFGWHEHLYAEVLSKNTIVSSVLKEDLKPEELEGHMGATRVIVCTLAMLSSHALQANGMFATYQLTTLLIDEASQIRLDAYPHVFNRFKSALKRVCFFGDGKQLALYQSSQIPMIQSIFELPHLNKDALFLEMSYRMPASVTAFISQAMYSGKLKAGDNVSQEADCIEFVDVSDGFGESSGTSIINASEALEIVRLVKEDYKAEKDFCVLTPYDAQRNHIETTLKAEGLPWEDRCFNVDSFQGQEADVILISVVRTNKIGFLNEPRRSNVMLTRCKKKMVIVSKKAFVHGPAQNTLLGRLSASVGKQAWRTARVSAISAPESERKETLEESEVDSGWF